MDRPTSRPSASSLIPTEIWRDIFDLALSTWLLPGDGTNLLDDLNLFQRGCTSYREYRRVEHIRRSLCAVCWQWNQILQDKNINLVVSSLKYYAYPPLNGKELESTQRMETFAPSCTESCDGTCGSRRINEAIQKQYEKNCIRVDRNLELIQPPLIDFSHMSSLRVLIQENGIGCSRNNLNNLTSIFRSPLLRVVSTSMDLCEWGLPMPTFLTHLTLQCHLYAQQAVQLQIPHLKFLSLYLSIVQRKTDADTELVPCPFDQWNLPTLVTLRLSGTLNEEGWGLVQQMVLNCSSTLVNLISNFELAFPQPNAPGERMSPLRIIQGILHHFPRLAIFGTTISSLLQRKFDYSSDPYDHLQPTEHSNQHAKGLSLLLLGMKGFVGVGQVELGIMSKNLENELDIFLRPSGDENTAHPFNHLILPFKWSEIGPIWEDQYHRQIRVSLGVTLLHPSVKAWMVLKSFITRDMKVFDAEGIELYDEKDGGKKLFESVV